MKSCTTCPSRVLQSTSNIDIDFQEMVKCVRGTKSSCHCHRLIERQMAFRILCIVCHQTNDEFIVRTWCKTYGKMGDKQKNGIHSAFTRTEQTEKIIYLFCIQVFTRPNCVHFRLPFPVFSQSPATRSNYILWNCVVEILTLFFFLSSQNFETKHAHTLATVFHSRTHFIFTVNSPFVGAVHVNV